MSHVATNWAFLQRGLSPAQFRLLAILADYHNPDFGCFPSQESLADRCEISRATVNRHLDELERKAVIRREQQVDARTQRQKNTRYMLAFEEGFVPLDVDHRVSDCDTAEGESRVSNCDTENSEQTEELAGDNSPTRVSETGGAVSHSSETLSGKEPITPLPPKAASLFEGLVHIWPADRHGNLDDARASFLRLDASAQGAAHRVAKSVLIGMVRQKRNIPKLPGYLDSRLFDEFDGAPEIDADGAFIITPERPEWSPWMGWIRTKHGQRGVDSIVKTGRFVPKTRWPEGHANAARANGHG